MNNSTAAVINEAKRVLNEQADAVVMLRNVIEANPYQYDAIIEALWPVATGYYERRIIITGVGKNANLAMKASETFASLGIPSMYLNSCHYSHGDAGFIGPEDIVIHVSRSGTTAELVFAAEHLKKIRPDVVQILLHCNPDKKEHNAFDIEFCTGKAVESDVHRLAPTTSTTVLLALLDTIGINLSRMRGFERLDFLKFHPGGALGQMLKDETK